MKQLLSILFFLFVFSMNAQEKSKLIPYKIGVLYNFGNEENFLFNDKDYYYITNTIKAQLFYKLTQFNNFKVDLIFQPQIQFLKHQLLNIHFVRPEEENYLQKRETYALLKNMNLYSFETALSIRRALLKKLNIQFSVGLGLSYIDTPTERLAKGFTFIENFSLGFNYKTSAKTNLYLGSNFGHVSNFNFANPNSGYNILGLEVGVAYQLK